MNSTAAFTESLPTDWHRRLRILSAARPGIEVHAALLEKAPCAGANGNPRATLEQVIDFEKAAGIRLPDDYVFFITMVGYKGSENCWFLTLEDWDAGYWSETKLERDLCAPCLITPELKDLGAQWMGALGVEDAERKWDRDEWDPMRGSMTIIEYGCGLYFRMIMNGPHYGRVFIWGEHAMSPPVFGPELTFSDWITRWL